MELALCASARPIHSPSGLARYDIGDPLALRARTVASPIPQTANPQQTIIPFSFYNIDDHNFKGDTQLLWSLKLFGAFIIAAGVQCGSENSFQVCTGRLLTRQGSCPLRLYQRDHCKQRVNQQARFRPGGSISNIFRYKTGYVDLYFVISVKQFE